MDNNQNKSEIEELIIDYSNNNIEDSIIEELIMDDSNEEDEELNLGDYEDEGDDEEVSPQIPFQPLEPFKIEEYMPDELKKQLEEFNKGIIKYNEIRSEPIETYSTLDEDDDYTEEETESYEDDNIDEEKKSDIIEEDTDEIIGDLF